MDLATVLDIAIGLATLLGMVGSAAGAAWLFFRKRLSHWWSPYRAGIEAMQEVPAMRRSIDAGRQEIEQVRASMGMLTMTVRARGDANVDAAEFECGPDGANTYVNQTYARWLGVGKAELTGWGWINFIAPEDRDIVRAEWASCRAEHRPYRIRHSMVDSDGVRFRVETLATPIPDAPPAQQWIGVMRRIDG
ncbi:PAS domain-containing protein [Lysobacter olei]